MNKTTPYYYFPTVVVCFRLMITIRQPGWSVANAIISFAAKY